MAMDKEGKRESRAIEKELDRKEHLTAKEKANEEELAKAETKLDYKTDYRSTN